jgi:hypothetical protein
MAVGSFFNSSSVSRNLADSWDGTSWTGVPTPNPGPAGRWQFLEDVSCPPATACTAVGYSWTPGSPDIPLVESWDGTSWTVVHAPNPATSGGNTLMGVSCPSATACTAVGYSYISGGFYRTFIESWDGTSWTVVPSPNPVPGGDYLNGVSCASATACMAVGYDTKNSAAPGLSRTTVMMAKIIERLAPIPARVMDVDAGIGEARRVRRRLTEAAVDSDLRHHVKPLPRGEGGTRHTRSGDQHVVDLHRDADPVCSRDLRLRLVDRRPETFSERED